MHHNYYLTLRSSSWCDWSPTLCVPSSYL